MILLVTAEVLAIQALAGSTVEGIFTMAGLPYTVLRPLLQLAVETAVLAAAAKTSIRLMEKKYRVM